MIINQSNFYVGSPPKKPHNKWISTISSSKVGGALSSWSGTNSCCARKILQWLPDDLEEKITSFQSFVIRARRSKNYSLVKMGNMDETPVWFDRHANIQDCRFRWSQNRSSENNWSWEDSFHSRTGMPCRWNQTSTDGHLQAKNDAKRQIPRWRSGT